MRGRVMLFIIAAAFTAQIYAADSCKPGDPAFQACIEKFADDWAPRAQEDVDGANTGISNLASPSQSAAKDFLSRLAAALLVPTSGSGAGPLAIDYNIPVPLLGEQHLKLQAVLERPDLSDSLKQRLAGNTATLTKTKDSLSELDDITVSAALEPSTQGLGRSLTPHRPAYVALLAAHLRGVEEARQGAVAREFAQPFAVLLSNQPQFFGSVIYHSRKNIAGADEQSARLTYEMGFRNLNTFFRENRGCVEPKDDMARANCAAELIKHAGVTDLSKDPGNRMAFSIEYRQAKGFTVLIPNAAHFRASDANSFVYSLSYGRNRMMMDNGRLDLSVNYEDTSVSEVTDLSPSGAAIAPAADAPKPVRDRFVASATYTYKINNNMAMPVTLTYANHASYLGDVGRKLNAHFGITFKMPNPR